MNPNGTLVLASGNAGKLAEMRDLLAPLGLKLRPQSEWKLPEAVEDAPTFIENALIKARHAARYSGLPALADDSGLVVPSLDGMPGIHSARYAGVHGDDGANNKKLLDALSGVPADARRAHFYCAMVLLRWPQDPSPLVSLGLWSGSIADEPRGEEGFGYDPLFLVDGLGCTSAQLDAESKNRISHRGRAASGLIQMLRDDPD
jgi:XTP/dITP diphosphohydrolase